MSRNISKSVDTGLQDSKLINKPKTHVSSSKSKTTVTNNNNNSNNKTLQSEASASMEKKASNIKKALDKEKQVEKATVEFIKQTLYEHHAKKNGGYDKQASSLNKSSFQSEKLFTGVNSFFDESDDEDDDDDDDDEDEDYEDDDEEDDAYNDLKRYFDDENNNRVNYEFFNYDFDSSEKSVDPKSIYADSSQFYGGSNYSYRAQNSPACFQPGFFPRTTRSRMTPQPTETTSSQHQHQHQQQQHQQQQQSHLMHQSCHHQSYFSRNQPGYYASWYGSAPSLRIPSKHHHRQSLFLN